MKPLAKSGSLDRGICGLDASLCRCMSDLPSIIELLSGWKRWPSSILASCRDWRDGEKRWCSAAQLKHRSHASESVVLVLCFVRVFAELEGRLAAFFPRGEAPDPGPMRLSSLLKPLRLGLVHLRYASLFLPSRPLINTPRLD